MYVVYLYVEGGEFDAESRAAGPFAARESAELCANDLADCGNVQILPLAIDADEVRVSLGMRDV